ncbi:thioredoxin family protein [Buchananella hordeovulneris]|uniref:thioredoxin family protein n=1 Tax=Buchananella hordeovulneris TaxID=52770 RepID=UPI0013012471|nr:thioredoxin family protein [Buchananella hordeovulneris]
MIGAVGDWVDPREVGDHWGTGGSVVLLATPLCRPCQAARTRAHLALRDYPQVNLVEINVAEHFDIAARFQVRATPTVLFVRADGRVTARWDGQVPGQAGWRIALKGLGTSVRA